MKRKISKALALPLVVVIALVTIIVSINAATKANDIEHVYYTNFEGMIVNESSTVDNNTGFIWSNNWQKTKTVLHNDSTMLEMPLYDSDTYSILGGFGIASNSNLAKCISGEAYTVETYFEMENIEYMFVEFVGGDGKWGSVIIYPDGSVMENTGGSNMSNVSYISNLLKFTFTMSFNQQEGVNGYIKFTAYNTHDGKVYLDNVSIDYTEHVLDDGYEQMPIGSFDTHSANIFNHYYAEEGVTSEFIKVEDDVKAKMSFTSTQNNSGEVVFYINKLGFLNQNRNYNFTLDLETENIDYLWIYHGGTWCEPVSYIKLNLTTNELEVFGNSITKATYQDKVLNIDFNTNVTFADWKQFQFIAQVSEVNTLSTVTLDNLKITQSPITSEIKLDLSKVKQRYTYGEDLDLSGIVIEGILSNGTNKDVDLSLCTVTGYDKSKAGKQVITVSYEGVTESFEIYVSRVIEELIVGFNGVKTNYQYGEDIDLSNLNVIATYVDDGEDVTLVHGAAIGGYAIDLGGYDKYSPGTYTITIYYLDSFVTFDVVVNAKSSVNFDNYTYQATGK